MAEKLHDNHRFSGASCSTLCSKAAIGADIQSRLPAVTIPKQLCQNGTFTLMLAGPEPLYRETSACSPAKLKVHTQLPFVHAHPH